MAGRAANGGERLGSRWRVVAWGVAAGLLLLPLLAMQVTDEVAWTLSDFVVAGALMGGAGVAYELAARRTGRGAYRAAVAVALAAAVLLLWLNGAVGLIGSEDDPANRAYGGVLATGLLGAVLARFRPQGMAHAMAATALAQALAPVAAPVAGWASTAPILSMEVLALTGIFVALWLLSAGLFRKAARAP